MFLLIFNLKILAIKFFELKIFLLRFYWEKNVFKNANNKTTNKQLHAHVFVCFCVDFRCLKLNFENFYCSNEERNFQKAFSILFHKQSVEILDHLSL